MAAPAITAESGLHPAAKQLAAYNARQLDEFLQCFDAPNLELRDLATGATKMTAAQIAKRYATVFEHSTGLSAKVTKRVLVSNIAPRADAQTFTVDFEQFSGLVGPTGGALDGSTGLAPPAAGDIVVVYRVIEREDQQVIDTMWVGEDSDGIGRMENAPLALVKRSAVWQVVDALVREQYGFQPDDEMQVQYVKWDQNDDAIAQQSPTSPPEKREDNGVVGGAGAPCWLCNKNTGKVLRGCRCGKRAHAACVAEAATSNRHLWLQCPGCQQEWSGKLGLELAKSRFVRHLRSHRALRRCKAHFLSPSYSRTTYHRSWQSSWRTGPRAH